MIKRAIYSLSVVAILCSSSGCYVIDSIKCCPLLNHPFGCGSACGPQPFETCSKCLGCGELYWGDWPEHCDPCDQCGNWVGPHAQPYATQGWYDHAGAGGYAPGGGWDDEGVILDEYYGDVAQDGAASFAQASRPSGRSPSADRLASRRYDRRESAAGPRAARRQTPRENAFAEHAPRRVSDQRPRTPDLAAPRGPRQSRDRAQQQQLGRNMPRFQPARWSAAASPANWLSRPRSEDAKRVGWYDNRPRPATRQNANAVRRAGFNGGYDSPPPAKRARPAGGHEVGPGAQNPVEPAVMRSDTNGGTAQHAVAQARGTGRAVGRTRAARYANEGRLPAAAHAAHAEEDDAHCAVCRRAALLSETGRAR